MRYSRVQVIMFSGAEYLAVRYSRSQAIMFSGADYLAVRYSRSQVVMELCRVSGYRIRKVTGHYV